MIEQLKDIKSLEVLTIDYTPYITALVLIVLLALILVGVFLFLRSKKVLSKKELAAKELKLLDFEQDVKTIVYSFTLYGKECVEPTYYDEFQTILEQLEPFKYKKDVESLPQDLVIEMKEFIKVRV